MTANSYRGSFRGGVKRRPIRTGFLLGGVKRPGREVGHSPPSSTEANNEWRSTSDPPTWLHGMDRYKYNVMTGG